MSGFPQAITEVGHVEPVPRRIRAQLGARMVLDTARALYVWEKPFYPQYLIPVEDLGPGAPAGTPAPGHEGYVRLEWDALDAWFEEDEEVFVHPRSPYVRVDALRSTRTVRVELEGVVLAETSAPVLVFETGLPTRTYFERTAVDLTHLQPSDTQTPCPYKGRTSAYWSFGPHADIAWSYDFTTRQLLPIAGLVAFFDEKVDVFVAGERQERPRTGVADRPTG